MCQIELRGLGDVHQELRKRGGTVLAISVDPPDKARTVVENNKLAFPILCDESREVTKAYGLLHPGGSPDGKDVPVPAHLLLDRSGIVVWEHVAKRIQDRPDPAVVIEAVRAQFPM